MPQDFHWGNVDLLLWRHMVSLDHNWLMHGFCEKYAACWKIQLLKSLMLRSLLYYCVIQCVAELTNFRPNWFVISLVENGSTLPWNYIRIKRYFLMKVPLWKYRLQSIHFNQGVLTQSSCFSDMDTSWLINFCIFLITLIDHNFISFNTD